MAILGMGILDVTSGTGGGGVISGGPTRFIQLLDVPSTYIGQALKDVRVNASETGLEFYTPGISAVDITYNNIAYPELMNVEEALDMLLYTAPTANMSSSVTLVEIGSTVTALTLSWSYNKTIVSQSINNGIGSLPAAQRSINLTGLSITSNTTWTLTGYDGSNNAYASAGVSFENKRFWGVSTDSTPTGSTLNSLSEELSTNRNQNRSINASGQYIYFGWPSSFGTPTFTVNGLLNTAWILTTISYTNDQGYTSSYDCYRSTYLQTGTGINVVVS